jgi:hypothetical protein
LNPFQYISPIRSSGPSLTAPKLRKNPISLQKR